MWAGDEPTWSAHPAAEPFGWWGPVWAPPVAYPLPDLVAQRVLSGEAAGLLAVLVEARCSIVVAAGPSGAGKTTLLTALLAHLPANGRRIYVRGCYEPFDVLDTADPRSTVLLVNEISPHLPIYLWGPGVRRVLQAGRAGFQVAATAHATSVEEFVYALSNYPLRVTAEEIRAVDLLLLLDAWRAGERIERRVRAVVSLSAAGKPGEVVPEAIARWDRGEDRLAVAWDAAEALYARRGHDPEALRPRVEERGADLAAE